MCVSARNAEFYVKVSVLKDKSGKEINTLLYFLNVYEYFKRDYYYYLLLLYIHCWVIDPYKLQKHQHNEHDVTV
jgi:hypothetical protein